MANKVPNIDWEVDVSEDQTVVSVFGHNHSGATFRLTISSNLGHDVEESMAEVVSIMMSLEVTRRLVHAFGIL